MNPLQRVDILVACVVTKRVHLLLTWWGVSPSF